eukprot:3542373-Rhodomonas_salina.2
MHTEVCIWWTLMCAYAPRGVHGRSTHASTGHSVCRHQAQTQTQTQTQTRACAPTHTRLVGRYRRHRHSDTHTDTDTQSVGRYLIEVSERVVRFNAPARDPAPAVPYSRPPGSSIAYVSTGHRILSMFEPDSA